MANATSAWDLSPLPSLSTDFLAQKWPTSIAVLAVSLLALFIKSTWQPAWPEGAPKLLREWPIVGAVQLFGQRKTFFLDACSRSPTGNFGIYVGKYQVVGLSGLEARKTFFETKALNMTAGYSVLFTSSPRLNKTRVGGVVEDFTSWMLRNMTKLLQRDNFVRNLPLLVSDTSVMLDDIVRRGGGGGGAKATTGIFDPFDDMYRIVYQMTMRTLGANEIADDLPLLWKTLALFEEIERGSSPIKIVFPWMPTVGALRQTIAGARLYAIFDGIAKKRKAEGREENDTFQYLLDSGADMVHVVSFIVGGIYAGQLNSGINAAWVLAFLANNPEWYRRVQAEVDASVEKHRRSPSQTPSEVLATLTLDDWESDFSAIDLALRESIRLVVVGTAFRRNIGDGEVVIGGTSERIARGALALYMPDDVHMDPAVYADPGRFDPGRFLPGRAEDRAVPLAYLGWGAGRHPCLGMRFARLEMGIITAMSAARFDWALVDGEGNATRALPAVDRERFSAHKPDEPVRLRFTERQR